MKLSALRRSRFTAAAAGLAGALAFSALVYAFPQDTAAFWRESAQDGLARLHTPAASEQVVVVDIDRASLAALGAWPWPRERLTRLLDAVSAAGAKAIGIDIVLEGPDRGSPVGAAAIAAQAAGRPELAAALQELDTGNRNLAALLGRIPAVLDFLLSDASGEQLPGSAPVAVSGSATQPLQPWHAQAGELPLPAFRSQGLGTGSLRPGPGGVIRSVPLFVTVGEQLGAGLALETVRVFAGAGSYIVDMSTGVVAVGPYSLPLGRQADLRFRASPPEQWEGRSVAAAPLLAGAVDPERLRGRIVLVGGSAPELGVLRATAQSPITPSVQVQADAAQTMLSGTALLRPDVAPWVEIGAGLALALLCAGAFAFLPPSLAAVIVVVAVAGWAAIVVAALLAAGLLLDLVTPSLAGLLAAVPAGLVTYANTRRSAEIVRQRFERHLAPAVVARIVAQPHLVKLGGERRVVTVLSTDIENFTAMVDRIDPAALVWLLDTYLGRVTSIVIEHGGLVDKVIGDSVHAIFNAPLDVPDHETRAIACAFAVLDFTEAFEQRPESLAAGLGRTRVGIETGEAVVGEFGAEGKLDYTAHGSAVNTASRLEGLNKTFGTSVCVGPTCRSRVTAFAFRALGLIEVRGRGGLEVFEPIRPAAAGAERSNSSG